MAQTFLDESASFKHCDDYIRDKTQPKCLRKFLLYHRIPAAWKIMRWRWGEPVCYATFVEPKGPGGKKPKRRRVRLVMASRLGDVGITADLSAERGYTWRVAVEDLSEFSDKP